MTEGRILPNGGTIARSEIPVVDPEEFRDSVAEGVRAGARLAALFAAPAAAGARLYALLAWKERGVLSVLAAEAGERYPALTPACEQAHLFEREIAEQWRVEPVGHPWLKPVRFELPRRPGRDLWPGQSEPPACAVMDFFRVEGEEVHEVAVGPVHAGIIEPGHFRFQCHGETVHHLEIALGYQHRGVERALEGGPSLRTLPYVETLAGDTTVGHAYAYCRALEALARCRVPARAQIWRGIALELERIANHLGDLGALAGDIGFLPTMSYCGRIRGEVLNLTAALCGNRFGRGLLRPGGVGWDADAATVERLQAGLRTAMRDAESAVGLLWETPSVLARFESAGPLSAEAAGRLGLVGPAARASGVDADVRRDFPYGIYRLTHIPVATGRTGDVFARAFVRWQEAQRSAAFIQEQLEALPPGEIQAACGEPAPDRLAAALVEGWRGAICHVVLTDGAGRLERYKVVDPSFLNWFGLAYAMRGQPISDFPLCNKSFNLSYCGFDL